MNLPIIADVEITTDSAGRYNLNLLHKASGLGRNKEPNKWLRTDTALALKLELESQAPDMAHGINPIDIQRGGNSPGTFAVEQLAVAYASWISPRFYLQVISTFIDYKTGQLGQRQQALSTLDLLQIGMTAEKERLRLVADVEELEWQSEVNRPRVDFANTVQAAGEDMDVRQAAQILANTYGLKIGQQRLFSYLRDIGWIDKKGKAYQRAVDQKVLSVKYKTRKCHRTGAPIPYTQVLVSTKGLTRLHERLHAEQEGAAC